MEPIGVGDLFLRKKGGCPHLVLLLSSDKYLEWEGSGPVWRCAQFQASSSDFVLFGAQIVLYAEKELDTFAPAGKLEYQELKGELG